MVHSEAEFLIIEGGKRLGADIAPDKRLIISGIYLSEADLVDRCVDDHFLTVEAGMVIVKVGVHVGQGGEREIDGTLAVGMNVYPVLAHVQSGGHGGRGVGHTLITDERHTIIVDVRHTGLEKPHLVGESLEIF